MHNVDLSCRPLKVLPLELDAFVHPPLPRVKALRKRLRLEAYQNCGYSGLDVVD